MAANVVKGLEEGFKKFGCKHLVVLCLFIIFSSSSSNRTKKVFPSIWLRRRNKPSFIPNHSNLLGFHKTDDAFNQRPHINLTRRLALNQCREPQPLFPPSDPTETDMPLTPITILQICRHLTKTVSTVAPSPIILSMYQLLR